MNRLYYRTIDLFLTLFSKEYRRHYKIAASIATRFKMAKAYKQARRFGLSPIEALEDNVLYNTQANQKLFPNN